MTRSAFRATDKQAAAPGQTAMCSSSAAGKQLPKSPKFAVNAGFDYIVAFPVGKFDFNTNYAFTGTFYSTPDNVIREKSYGLLDISLTYMLGNTDRWSLRVYGKNITGEQYFISAQENFGPPGYVYAPRAPAEYGGNPEL